MIYSFMFSYLIGAFVFFCHTTIKVSKISQTISSQLCLTENETDELVGIHFTRTLFQTVMMIIFPISFTLYNIINTYFNNIFVSSGLFTIIWLALTGMLIEFVYFIVTQKLKVLQLFCLDKYYQNKEFLWVMCPILYGILFSFCNSTIVFTILAIVLGKYIWMDTFKSISSISSLKIKVIEFFKKSKLDIILLIYQAIVMLFILFRWYSVKDKPLSVNNLLSTALLFILFLRPILDFLIYESMKSYCKLIISSSK